jgi:aspartyl-tRNA(Asn)/glutamyl-tRNA(Gln) amidotransferase subunit A
MTATPIYKLTIVELSEMIRDRHVSCLEVVEEYLERIRKHNSKLNAYITIDEEGALKEARKLDELIKEGKYLGPLHGIPIAIKDLIDVKGLPTTCGSKNLANNVASRDAKLVSELRKNGAIIIGKTNCHEFGIGATNRNASYGDCKNPWDMSRISGGSSGGSAAAVSAGLCAASIGTDTGGSIRIPSSLCGVVGLKPTYGSVSLHGVVPLAPSLDTVGSITRTSRDAEIILKTISGTYYNILKEQLNRTTDKITLGVLETYIEHSSIEVVTLIEKILKKLEQHEVILNPVNIRDYRDINTVTNILMLSEAAATHDKYLRHKGISFYFDKELIHRLLTGRLIPAHDYINAIKLRKLFQTEINNILRNFDALICPTIPITAPKISERRIKIENKSGIKRFDVTTALTMYTRLANLTGLPALTVPCGLTNNELPVGVQLIGKKCSERKLFYIGNIIENLTGRFLPPSF